VTAVVPLSNFSISRIQSRLVLSGRTRGWKAVTYLPAKKLTKN